MCGLIQLYKGSAYSATINVVIQICNAILLAYYYSNRNLVQDLYPALKIYVLHALISLFVVSLLPESVFSVGANILGKHLCYVFYRINSDVIPSVPRLSGLAWEPGCLQLLLNVYLFLIIQDETKKIKDFWWVFILILATGSTSGYAIMLLNLIVYGLSRARSNFLIVVSLALLFVVSVLPFMWDNIAGKLMLGTESVDTSGVMRYRDFYTGLYCLRDYPILGIDMTTDPSTNHAYQTLEQQAISQAYEGNWYQYFDFGDGGYTNGLFGMTMMWGLFGLYLLYRFVRCSLWRQFSTAYWHIVPLIFCLSLISEPISNTAFFWFFCIYDIVNKNKKNQLYDKNINSYCHLERR